MKLPKVPYPVLLLGPAVLFGLGLILNAIVCGMNGASMPVLVPKAIWEANGGCPIDPEDWIHHCMTAQSHLKVLADWIAIRDFGVASPGDILEFIGGATFIPSLVAWVTCIIKDHQK